MANPVSYLTNYELSQRVAGYMQWHFCSLAFPDLLPVAPPIPLDLPVDLSVGMHQMVATLVTAYQNRGMYFQYLFGKVLMCFQLSLVWTS